MTKTNTAAMVTMSRASNLALRGRLQAKSVSFTDIQIRPLRRVDIDSCQFLTTALERLMPAAPVTKRRQGPLWSRHDDGSEPSSQVRLARIQAIMRWLLKRGAILPTACFIIQTQRS